MRYEPQQMSVFVTFFAEHAAKAPAVPSLTHPTDRGADGLWPIFRREPK